jgi:aspartate/methionine/tyrosine aminotransferase
MFAATSSTDLTPHVRAEALAAPQSGITEVFMYGWGRPGLIPLWAGEGDMSTPAFITEATTRSLAVGETFYTPNRGIPEFRASVARYMSKLYGQSFAPERFLCTIGGMHALQIAMRMALSAGDEFWSPRPLGQILSAAVK